MGDRDTIFIQYRSVQPGRTPEWNVVADLEPTVWLEAVDLASDGRLSLPAPLRRRVEWCATKKAIHLLATIGSSGEIAVEPMSRWDDARAAITSLLEARPIAERQALLLGAMASHFRISLQPDGRLRLPTPLIHHLARHGKAQVWVSAYANQVTLWSEADWSAFATAKAVEYREAVGIAAGD
ncbi:MAG: hypothetical protein WCY11_17020 [Novosphingobium sp.]|tara:strand:- start:7046 stop:7591 length:546 start_codon:yes stop_codon:yes gene_type:complete